MDDYINARTITTPFGLYDCDVPCDGAVAVIVSRKDLAGDMKQPAVHLEAVGTAITERMSWDQGALDHEPLVQGPAAHLWTRTDLKPADIDMAQLYDGFSFNCLSWIEALGFCGWGEAKDFLDGGTNIALDGVLPLNTHGGQLSSGRLHGYGFIHEAVTQLRGHAGERQVRERGDRGREQRRGRARRRVPLHQGTLTDTRGRAMQRFYDDEGMNFAVLNSASGSRTPTSPTSARRSPPSSASPRATSRRGSRSGPRPLTAWRSRRTSRWPATTASAPAPSCCARRRTTTTRRRSRPARRTRRATRRCGSSTGSAGTAPSSCSTRPVEKVQIPYEGTTLEGYFFTPNDGTRLPARR